MGAQQYSRYGRFPKLPEMSLLSLHHTALHHMARGGTLLSVHAPCMPLRAPAPSGESEPAQIPPLLSLGWMCSPINSQQQLQQAEQKVTTLLAEQQQSGNDESDGELM